MQRFHCHCGQRLFFENVRCLGCGREVGYDPATHSIRALEPGAGDEMFAAGDGARLRHCRNGILHAACNWLVATGEDAGLCRSCRLNRTVPDLSVPGNMAHWLAIERAKRRLLHALLQLGLCFEGAGPGGAPALAFEFLEDRRRNPRVAEEHVLTGHADGLITINVAEADDVQRERTRRALGEPYRTLLGHFRHEIGHFFFERVLPEGPRREAFRTVFGDERADYAHALEEHYRLNTRNDWNEHYVSAYARTHPLEDWAECWAHTLHALDTVETARANGLLAPAHADESFDEWVYAWMRLTVSLNELNRSLGVRDAYPFVLTQPVIRKLRFVRSVLARAATST